jgi:hypothetical protein
MPQAACEVLDAFLERDDDGAVVRQRTRGG